MGTTITNERGQIFFPRTDGLWEDGIARQAEVDGLFIATLDQHRESLRISHEQGIDIGRRRGHDAARSGIIEYFRDVQGDTEGLNDLLEHLGYERYATKWRVTLSIEGSDVLTVIVEADDEDEAEQKVSYGVSQYSTTVDVEFDFSGEGEVEDSQEYEYEFGDLFDFLSYEYTVEEYSE